MMDSNRLGVKPLSYRSDPILRYATDSAKTVKMLRDVVLDYGVKQIGPDVCIFALLSNLGAKGPVNVMIREPMVGHRVDSTGPGDGKPPATLRMSWTKEGGCWMSILYHSNLNTGELVVLAVAEACSGEVNSAWNINQGLEHCSSGLCSDKGVGLRQKIYSVRPGPRPLHFGGCHPWQHRGG